MHSPKWTAKVVEDELWQRADQQVQNWHEQGEDALAIWDSSEWEKPESMASEGLSAVRSSKAKRLTHIKPGYYNPPSRPIFVPGMRFPGGHCGGSLGAAWSSSARRDALVE